METFLEILKAILYGIVEGITEWLPISSTGHMILLDEFVGLKVSPEFWSLFLVVIQLGAILAVVVLYFKKLWPLGREEGKVCLKKDILLMWAKALITCVPAGIVGILFGDKFDELFYHPTEVALALIVFGVAFIVIENLNRGRKPRVKSIDDITFRDAALLGFFQMIAAVFPGASRSGMMIIGGLMLGLSRRVAARFTFYVAVPVMLGASLLKIVKFIGNPVSGLEIVILLVGMVTAFLVSVIAIRALMNYVRKHNFKVFGYYRIALGLLVLLYFGLLVK